MIRRLYFFFAFFVASQITLLSTTGCKKEYSYEGQDSTIIKKDTILSPVSEFPPCSLCNVNDPAQEAKWSFKTGNSYLCGVIDTGIITSDKNAFTFFGPSACSIDSGLVITAYMDSVKLNADKFNITTNKVAFYYYDHNATSYIFISQQTINFSLTIQSFISSTGIATGTFSGGVFKPNGETAIIKEGRFKVQLR